MRMGLVALLVVALGGVAEAKPIPLPTPTLDGTVSLEAALQARRSNRRYTDESLTRAELGQLLWALAACRSAPITKSACARSRSCRVG